MGNKKLQIVKQGENSKWSFQKEKIITNQLFARLKQKKRKIFLENLKKLEVQAKKSIR